MTQDISKAAAALGRIGGSKNTPAQQAARAKHLSRKGWPKGKPRKGKKRAAQCTYRPCPEDRDAMFWREDEQRDCERRAAEKHGRRVKVRHA